MVAWVDGVWTRRVGPFALSDLPPGAVLVRVAWSSVNYKDGLASVPDGRVARTLPLIPGIDLAGMMVASTDARFREGAEVLVHGHHLGVSRHAGYAAYQPRAGLCRCPPRSPRDPP